MSLLLSLAEFQNYIMFMGFLTLTSMRSSGFTSHHGASTETDARGSVIKSFTVQPRRHGSVSLNYKDAYMKMCFKIGPTYICKHLMFMWNSLDIHISIFEALFFYPSLFVWWPMKSLCDLLFFCKIINNMCGISLILSIIWAMLLIALLL